jgi:hypothetical protein
MKLKTFNRYAFLDGEITCGTVAIALITGESPGAVKNRLNNLRRQNNWSEAKIQRESPWTYWHEAMQLISRAAKTKTVYPCKNLPLREMKCFKKGETYLVCTTEHLQIVKDGMVYDTCACMRGRQIELHPWSKRKVWYYSRLRKK